MWRVHRIISKVRDLKTIVRTLKSSVRGKNVKGHRRRTDNEYLCSKEDICREICDLKLFPTKKKNLIASVQKICTVDKGRLFRLLIKASKDYDE